MQEEKFRLLNESLKALSIGKFNLLICKGEAGFGKTYNILKFMKDGNLKYKYISSYATPLRFYDLLYQNKDQEVIIFDDVQSIDNNLIKGMLKSACWGALNEKRKVSYYTTSEAIKKLDIPEEFEIKANIILIFNDDIKEYEAITSRAVRVDIHFKFEDKIKIFEELKQKAKIDQEIIQYIKEVCDEATKNLSIRSLVILTRLKEGGFNWRLFAKEMFEIDEDKKLLISLVQKCNSIECACKEWATQTGKSRRTFFNYKKQMGL